MRILRTPESRFKDLKDYPFTSHYIEVDGLQMHYLDEGPVDSSPVLLIHGVPAWSYLYRHIIPVVADAGNRVIVPDLIGFGKSDKPAEKSDHTYRSHVDWMKAFIGLLKLDNILLFGHDWGSLIGLRVAAEQPGLFGGIIICNGGLPTGEQKMHITFKIWELIARYSPVLPVDLIISAGINGTLGKREKQAYRAPFPSPDYKAGIRALPQLVPASLNDPESYSNREAWINLAKWERPFLTAFSDGDPITRGGDKYLRERIPGSAGQDHVTLNGGHFIQEEKAEVLAGIIIRFRKKIDSLQLN